MKKANKAYTRLCSHSVSINKRTAISIFKLILAYPNEHYWLYLCALGSVKYWKGQLTLNASVNRSRRIDTQHTSERKVRSPSLGGSLKLEFCQIASLAHNRRPCKMLDLYRLLMRSYSTRSGKLNRMKHFTFMHGRIYMTVSDNVEIV